MPWSQNYGVSYGYGSSIKIILILHMCVYIIAKLGLVNVYMINQHQNCKRLIIFDKIK